MCKGCCDCFIFLWNGIDGIFLNGQTGDKSASPEERDECGILLKLLTPAKCFVRVFEIVAGNGSFL
jgi:hypothetical protein